MDEILAIITGPFVTILSPDTRLYWMFLLISLYIAIGVIMITAHSSGQSLKQSFAEQLSRKIWWSRSARADYKYYIINGIFYGLIFAPLVLASAEIGLWVETNAIGWFGPLDAPMFDALPMRVAYTIIFFMAFDFGQFITHWIQHQSQYL
mgnify:CR=1 FL=1